MQFQLYLLFQLKISMMIQDCLLNQYLPKILPQDFLIFITILFLIP